MKPVKLFVCKCLSLFLMFAICSVFAGNTQALAQEPDYASAVNQEENDSDNERKYWWSIPKDTVFKNFYGGVGTGVALGNSPRSNDDGSVNDPDTDKVDMSGKTFIGYEFNEYLGVEAGYNYLGKTKYEGVSTGGPSWSAGPVEAVNEVQGGNLSAVVRLPVTDRLTLIGTAGMFWWYSKETFVDNGVKSEQIDQGKDYTFSGGIEYDIGVKDRFVWRTEVDRYVVDASSYDITQGTFSVVYKFP